MSAAVDPYEWATTVTYGSLPARRDCSPSIALASESRPSSALSIAPTLVRFGVWYPIHAIVATVLVGAAAGSPTPMVGAAPGLAPSFAANSRSQSTCSEYSSAAASVQSPIWFSMVKNMPGTR